MKQYKVWIHVERIEEDRDIYQDVGECYPAGCFDTEEAACDYIEQKLLTTKISGSAADLLEACKELTSFICDMLCRTNNPVDLKKYEEMHKVHQAISNYRPAESIDGTVTFQTTLLEQSPQYPPRSIPLNLLSQDGQLWIRPEGYGEKCAAAGEGSPVGMEIWQGRLRLVIFDDINSEDPRIIDLEKARESGRK